MSGAIPPLPHFLAWCSVKHRDNIFPYTVQSGENFSLNLFFLIKPQSWYNDICIVWNWVYMNLLNCSEVLGICMTQILSLPKARKSGMVCSVLSTHRETNSVAINTHLSFVVRVHWEAKCVMEYTSWQLITSSLHCVTTEKTTTWTINDVHI
jgi:hypothetical protein